MNHVLREDFGFKHFTWIYSGRRGVHCWVSDASARALSNEARAAIINYCSLVTVGVCCAVLLVVMPFNAELAFYVLG
jgi:DNA primase small subunit